MAYSAGTAYLEIVPSFLNVETLIARAARDIAKNLDKTLGKQLGTQLGQQVREAGKDAERESKRAGDVTGRTFADAAMKRVNAALANIPVTDRILKPLRKELQSISEIDVTKGFDERDFIARVEKAFTALRKAQQDAQGVNAVGRYTNAGNAAQELGAVKDIVEQARRRGFLAGDAFSDAYTNRLKAMDRILPDLKTTAKSTQEERAVAALKARIAEAMKLQVGDVATRDNNPLNLKIGAKINGEDLKREIEQIEGLLDQFSERFSQIELVLPLDKARQQATGFFDDIKTQEDKANEQAAAAYLKAWDDAVAERDKRERAAREAIARDHERAIAEDFRRQKKAQDDLNKLYDDAVAEDHKRTKRALDAMSKLYDDAVGEDYKRAKKAQDQLAKLYDDAVAEDHKRTKRALDAMSKLYDDAVAEDYKRSKQQREAFLRDWDQALNEARKRQLRADAELERERQRAFGKTTAGDAAERAGRAADRIVDLPVHLQANSVDREMASIRARIKALGDVKIGVDVDVESFADDVQREFNRLKQIAQNNKIDMEVRVDAAGAASELGAILVLVNRIDGDKAEVKVDADSSIAGLKSLASELSLNLGRLGALIATGASIGTAIVPAAAAAASMIGAIGTAALGALSGVGVLMLAFSGIGDAVKAMGQFADDQQKTAVSQKRSANQIASALDQIRSAEKALANTRRNNAEAAAKAQRAIKEALEDQRDAVEDVARANKDAIDRVADAQRNLTKAAQDEKEARDKLKDAYVQAKRALADLFSQIRGNTLDQRQAVLDVAEAKAELDKLMANPRATKAEREQADITYQQKLLQLDDLQRKGGELADDQEKQFREGIEQSKQVKAAREDIASAEERRLDAQKALTKAQSDLIRTQLDGTRKLRDAEQKVADSRRAASEQQRDAAYAEYQATQAIVAARRQLENATDRSAVAGGAAMDNLNTAMAKLSPTAQEFARYIFGLRDAFYALRGAADPVLSGLQKAMTQLIGATSDEAKVKLAPFFDFVNRVAVAIGDMFQRFADTLQGPTFGRFFKYISDTAVPTLDLLYQMFENITLGFINLFLAFTPLTGQVSDGLLDMTERFRDWSETLSNNAGFQEFLGYLRDSGPQVAHLLFEIAKSVGKLVIAAAPVGSVVVDMFTKLFELINKIPEKTLISLVAGISAAAGALALLAFATTVAGLSVAGLVAGGIAVLVVALSALAGTSGKTGEFLRNTWDKIKNGAIIAFNLVKQAIVALRPVFDNIVEAGRAFYDGFLVPLFEAFKALFVSLYQALQPSFNEIGGFLQKLGVLFWWLYDQVILPVYKGMLEATKILLGWLKPVFSLIGTIIGALAGVIFWLLNRVVMPVVLGIVKLLIKSLGPAFSFLWKYIIKPILQAIGVAIQIGAAILKVAIGIMILAVKALGAIFLWLYQNAIKPAWDALVKYVFRPMGDWIGKNIKPHWDKAIEAIAKKWESLKKIFGGVTKVIIKYALNDGLLKGYNWLADKFNISPKNVHIDEPTGDWYTKSAFATGGAVHGPGTGTSDSIPARLSRGEHVLTAREVQAAGGHEVIYALRREILRGNHPFHYARGGEVGDGLGDWLKKTAKSVGKKATDVFDGAAEFLKNPVKSITDLAKGLLDKVPYKDTWFVQRLLTVPNKIVDALKDKVTGFFGGGGGKDDGQTNGAMAGGNTLGGSLGMINILRQPFPGLSLTSGYRPNAITVTGNPSYHGKNRAVDVPPRRDVFEWIHANYPDSRELIFSPMGMRQIWNGKPHMYHGAVRSTHFNHVHWAYENGGLLPDTRAMPGGTMQVFHGRRTPDKVLTDSQWRNMATLANQARMTMAGGDTMNFEFRDTTLDEGKLAAIQARRDALNRVNRSNY
jgi:hypothetical protein